MRISDWSSDVCSSDLLNRKNVIILLMSIELMLLAVNVNFVAFSREAGDAAGQVFVFFILPVAAAEAAIGLAILVTLLRHRDRKSVVSGKSVSVRVAIGGRRNITKKKINYVGLNNI